MELWGYGVAAAELRQQVIQPPVSPFGTTHEPPTLSFEPHTRPAPAWSIRPCPATAVCSVDLALRPVVSALSDQVGVANNADLDRSAERQRDLVTTAPFGRRDITVPPSSTQNRPRTISSAKPITHVAKSNPPCHQPVSEPSSQFPRIPAAILVQVGGQRTVPAAIAPVAEFSQGGLP